MIQKGLYKLRHDAAMTVDEKEQMTPRHTEIPRRKTPKVLPVWSSVRDLALGSSEKLYNKSCAGRREVTMRNSEVIKECS